MIPVTVLLALNPIPKNSNRKSKTQKKKKWKFQHKQSSKIQQQSTKEYAYVRIIKSHPLLETQKSFTHTYTYTEIYIHKHI